MARNGNTYAKRQRDLQKKQKTEDKRARRLKRKENVNGPDDSGGGDPALGESSEPVEPGEPSEA